MKRTSLWEMRDSAPIVTKIVVLNRKGALVEGSDADFQSPINPKGR